MPPDEEVQDPESDDDEAILYDPFEQHYAFTSDKDFSGKVAAVKEQQWRTQVSVSTTGVKSASTGVLDSIPSARPVKTIGDLHLKRRLYETGQDVIGSLEKEEKELAAKISNYADVICGHRAPRSAGRLRDVTCLHALNHIFKTRDRILKNNTKASQQENGEDLDLRDQGFTRPKVLVVLPTRQSCVKYAETMIKISRPDQEENKKKFLDAFSNEEDDRFQQKPEDFRELFEGNSDEDFRIGIKFTRKTIKYFSSFYNSDIILASPLGLQQAITTAKVGKEKKKRHDADFLSSVEVVIVDQANALLMQNWQHLEYIFSQLNLLPKESHGCDFSRVRNWYLDGNAKFLRQTIILSSYVTPEINSLASASLFNTAGRVKYTPTYRGEMLNVSSALPMTVTQTFSRFESPSPLNDNDARFSYFTTAVLPPLMRDKNGLKGTLLYVPTYVDFVRLRNYLSTSAETTSLSFGVISEYSEQSDMRRTRSHFESGRYGILVYTERAHHYYRHRFRGIGRILFYGVPENPVFWSEIVGLLGLNADVVQSGSNKGKGRVRAMFSRWDVLKLERIVGTERVGRLVSEKGGDTFDFV